MSLEDEFKKVDDLYFCKNDSNGEDDLSDVSDTENFSSVEKFLPNSSIICDFCAQDIQEEEVVSKFFDKACCTKKCNFVVTRDMILQSRNNFLELDKKQQDLIILSKIEAVKPTSALDEAYDSILGRKKYGKRKNTERTTGNITFTYHKLPICRNLFLFLNACGIKRYKAFLHHFNNNGVVE